MGLLAVWGKRRALDADLDRAHVPAAEVGEENGGAAEGEVRRMAECVCLLVANETGNVAARVDAKHHARLVARNVQRPVRGEGNSVRKDAREPGDLLADAGGATLVDRHAEDPMAERLDDVEEASVRPERDVARSRSEGTRQRRSVRRCGD